MAHCRDWLIDWLTMMGWDCASQLRPPAGLLFIPRVICGHRQPWWWWWWCGLAITPDSSTRALWHFYQQRHLDQGMTKECEFCLSIGYPKYLVGSLTCRKILRNGTSSITSHRKEGVLRISITLKNPSPRPGLNPRPLGPAASTLTTEATAHYHDRGILWFISAHPGKFSNSAFSNFFNWTDSFHYLRLMAVVTE
jgi:hypothetical protein